MKKLITTTFIAASLAVSFVSIPTTPAFAQVKAASDISPKTVDGIVSLMSRWNSALTQGDLQGLLDIYAPEDREFVQDIAKDLGKSTGTSVEVKAVERTGPDSYRVRFVRSWGGADPGRTNVAIEAVQVENKILLKVPAAQKAALSQRSTPAAVTTVPESSRIKVDEIKAAAAPEVPAQAAAAKVAAAPAPVAMASAAPTAAAKEAKAAPAEKAAPAPAEPATSASKARLGPGIDQKSADGLAELLVKWNEAISEVDTAALVSLHIPEDKELVEKMASARAKSVDSRVSVSAIEKVTDDEYRIRIVRSWGGARAGRATNVLVATQRDGQYYLRLSRGPISSVATRPASSSAAPAAAGAPQAASAEKAAATTATSPASTAAVAIPAAAAAPTAAAAPVAVAASTATPAPKTSSTTTVAAIDAPAPKKAEPVIASPISAANAATPAAAPAATAATVVATAPAAASNAATPAAVAAAAQPVTKPAATPPAAAKPAAAPAQPAPAPAAANRPKADAKEVVIENSVVNIEGSARNVSAKVGHATLVRLPMSTSRVAVGDPNILDFTMINPKELYVLGKSVGTTNMILWESSGKSIVLSATVSVDLEPLSASIKEALPQERDVKVNAIAGSVVLSGSIADGLAAKTALDLAGAFVANLNRQIEGAGRQQTSGGQQTQPVSSVRVVDLLRLRDSQQVMLDVRIAEIQKTLLEQLGVSINRGGAGTGGPISIGGDIAYSILSGRFPFGSSTVNPKGNLTFTSASGTTVKIDAEKRDALVKILAEPSIVAMSGTEGSFLAGGTIYLPAGVSSGLVAGQPVEKEFGVSLKFLPTVLDGGRINLRVSPEVSELSSYNDQGLPTFTTRKVSTSVQLRSGQSLLIGGLLKNNLTQSVSAFPLLGELPIIGALFRSSDYNANKTELVVFVSPSIIKATDAKPEAPTDNFAPPDRSEFFLQGSMEKR